ncbi:MAG: DUF4831 family protein [Bacteroides sp.]|nr:DUF4831 family protein [Bacteroides sp.]
MKAKHITLIALAAAALTANAQTTQRLTASKLNEFGLIYALPVTVLDVTVEAKRTVKTPGEFFRYAKKYLGIDPITEPSDTWNVESVTVTPRGVADEEERYLVQLKGGATPFMLLDENDFPLTINSDDYTAPDAPQLPVAQKAEPTILQTPAAQQAVTEEMLRSTSSAKRAELAAAKIYELRQSRNDIISGNADQMPADGAAMKLALDNIERQEAALTAMFAGTEQVSTAVRTYSVKPTGEESERVVAGRVSVTEGPVDADNLSGVPVYIDIEVTERGTLPRNEKGEEKKFPKGGLAYRIPGSAAVKATVGGQTMYRGNLEVAQYGIVFGLDPSLFTDKKAPAYVIFDASTGAIRELGTK